MEIIKLPVNSVIYRGANLEAEKKFKTYVANWYTFNVVYACMYINPDYGALKMFNVDKPIKLLDITKCKLKDFSNKKDIKVGDIKISLRFLFSVIFGYGIEKNDIEFFKGDNLDNIKYKGTQLYEFYQLIKTLNDNHRQEKTLKWFNNILKKNIPKDMVKGKYEFNRVSDGVLDRIFLFELKRYKELDGYYAPKIKSNWSIVNCKDYINKLGCEYMQNEEIAIFNTDKISLMSTIKDGIKDSCKILSNKN